MDTEHSGQTPEKPLTVVVYQLGKVASTSLVNTLESVPEVKAYQAHFLGLPVFERILKTLTDPRQDEYARGHMQGQLMRNIELMREINAFKLGLRPDRALAFLSLSREPVDWFRSALTQDIGAYAPRLSEILGADAPSTVEATIDAGLRRILKNLSEIFQESRLLDRAKINPAIKAFTDSERLQGTPEGRLTEELAWLFLRPLFWFSDHMEVALGVSLQDLETDGDSRWRRSLPWCQVLVIRYEDLRSSLSWVASRLGLHSLAEMRADNVGSEKPLAGAVNDVFRDNDDVRMIQRLLPETEYCRHFGYGEDSGMGRVASS